MSSPTPTAQIDKPKRRTSRSNIQREMLLIEVINFDFISCNEKKFDSISSNDSKSSMQAAAPRLKRSLHT
jgi:hypothetical protein